MTTQTINELHALCKHGFSFDVSAYQKSKGTIKRLYCNLPCKQTPNYDGIVAHVAYTDKTQGGYCWYELRLYHINHTGRNCIAQVEGTTGALRKDMKRLCKITALFDLEYIRTVLSIYAPQYMALLNN